DGDDPQARINRQGTDHLAHRGHDSPEIVVGRPVGANPGHDVQRALGDYRERPAVRPGTDAAGAEVEREDRVRHLHWRRRQMPVWWGPRSTLTPGALVSVIVSHFPCAGPRHRAAGSAVKVSPTTFGKRWSDPARSRKC